MAKGGEMKGSVEKQYSKIAELEEKFKVKMQRHKVSCCLHVIAAHQISLNSFPVLNRNLQLREAPIVCSNY